MPRRPLAVTGQSIVTATQDSLFSGVAATFVDTGVPLDAENYGAAIAWGDGQTSAGTVTFNSTTQQFEVAGSHLYAEAGSYSTGVTIAAADVPLAASGQEVTFTPGTTFSGTVATFQDPGGPTDPSDFTATISWTTSQGTTITAGTVSYDSLTGQFEVGGSFTFPEDTGNQISVSISDGGSTATAISAATTLAMSLAQIAAHGRRGLQRDRGQL